MTGRRMAAPDRVLLVGIDRYLPAREPGGVSYPCLSGAVRDVQGMEGLLRRLGVPPERIERLVAPREGALPPAEQRPTYENLVAALKRLAEAAKPGEQILVFYAGHGGRVATAFPRLKGERGLDEALVPWNIGNPEARYLRDVELALLVRRMVDRGLYLTLILDCCHAGSALRKGPGVPRWPGRPDLRPRAAGSLAGSREELLAAWCRDADPGVPAPSGWLPCPRGYVLFAACEEHERALEYAFDGENREGVLTHALLESLAPQLRTSHRDLYRRVLAAVHSVFTAQTPQLEGDEDRYLFEEVREDLPRGVPVLRIDPGGGRVLLQAGEAQGVGPGTQFTIDGEDLPEPSRVEVVRSGSGLSWARVEGGAPASRFRPGSQARLAALPRPSCVRLLGPDPATQRIAAFLARQTQGFVRLSSPAMEPDLELAVDAQGRIEIRDSRGGRLPNQGRPLYVEESGWEEPLRERLLHLARFRALQNLSAPPETAPLSGKLRVRLARISRDGESLELELRNEARQPLSLTVLHLRPDWSLVQVHPPPALGRAGLPLGPGCALRRLFHRHLQSGIEQGPEEIQVFATARAAEFRWLQLPPLDPLLRARSEPARAAAPPFPLRHLEPEAVADRGWTMWRFRWPQAAGEQTSSLRVGTE